MSLVRINPLASRLLTRWPEMWDDDAFSLTTSQVSSGLEVYETENEVVIKANVAGVPENSIDLTFEKGVLIISAKGEEEKTSEKRTHYSRSSWEYSYRVAVPGEIDHDSEPKAIVENGVLRVTFRKAAKMLPRKLKVEKK